MTIAASLAEVRERMAAACRRAGRAPQAVRLMAVTKTVAPERIAEAIAAGQALFGENRVQELEAKRQALAGRAGLEWHLIGHLQSNKAARALAAADSMDSLDSPALAARLERLAAAAGKRWPVMIEVNVAGEPQKAGVAPAALPALAEAVAASPHLDLCGIMAIPPEAADPEASRGHFASLRAMWDRMKSYAGTRWELSMGMSHDFEVAIEEGATLVRVGSAIFGARAPRT